MGISHPFPAQVVDKDRGRRLFARCLDRCGDTLQDHTFDFLIRASPGAAFCADFQNMLPLHTLLSSCGNATPHMVKRLVAEHPKAGTHRGLKGWTPLHFFCLRNPTLPRAPEILKMLLETKSGMKACRTRDDKGDLPLHLFCQTCMDLKETVDAEIQAGNFSSKAVKKRAPKQKKKANARSAFVRRASAVVGLKDVRAPRGERQLQR